MATSSLIPDQPLSWIGNLSRVKIFFIYGFIAGILGVFILNETLPAADSWNIQGAREDVLNKANAALAEGAPPGTVLLKNGSYAFGNAADDQGLFIYIPLVSNLLGFDNVTDGTRALFLVLMFLTFTYYPLVVYKTANSWLAALLSPLFLLWGLFVLNSFLVQDYNWILIWVPLALLPIVLLVAGKTRLSESWPLILPLMAASGFASSFRNGAGLAILIALLGVLLFRTDERIGTRVALGLLGFATYVAMSSGSVILWEELSRSWSGDRFVDYPGTSHVFWHTFFLGLGYLPNDAGIRWDDSLAWERAVASQPNLTALHSDAYDETLRTLTLELLWNDPRILPETVIAKSLVLLNLIPQAVKVGLTVVFLTIFSRACLPLRLLVPIATPALFLGFGYGLIGVPIGAYVGGGLASALLIVFFLYFCFLRLLEPHFLGAFRRTVQQLRYPLPWLAVLLLFGTSVIGWLTLGGRLTLFALTTGILIAFLADSLLNPVRKQQLRQPFILGLVVVAAGLAWLLGVWPEALVIAVLFLLFGFKNYAALSAFLSKCFSHLAPKLWQRKVALALSGSFILILVLAHLSAPAIVMRASEWASIAYG